MLCGMGIPCGMDIIPLEVCNGGVHTYMQVLSRLAMFVHVSVWHGRWFGSGMCVFL